MVKVIEAFGCEHCSMASVHKSSVVRHEKENCRKNTTRRCCLNCKHYYTDFVDDHSDLESGFRSIKVSCCDKVEKKHLIPDNDNNNCEHFERKESSND